jgi:hypothetical protein
MVTLPALNASAPPSVRAPRFDLKFGSEDAHAWRTALVSLEVSLGMLPAVDHAVIVLAAPSSAGAPGGALGAAAGAALGGASAALGGAAGGGAAFPVASGDEGSIDLGFADAGPTRVFSGAVASVGSTLAGTVRVVAGNGATRLARLRLDQAFEQLSAGDVIRKLAEAAGVSVGSVEAGPTLAYLAVDGRERALDHVARLARRSDAAARIDPEGVLQVAPLEEGAPVATYRYGHDLLRLTLEDALPAVASVTVVGNGAAGSQGGEAAAWMVRDPAPVTATAGEGEPTRTLSDGAARSAEAAQIAARARAAAASRQGVTGTAVVPGAPEILPGATVELADVPFAGANGTFLVLAVRHRFHPRQGLVTRFAFARAGSGGGLLGGLPGGLP